MKTKRTRNAAQGEIKRKGGKGIKRERERGVQTKAAAAPVANALLINENAARVDCNLCMCMCVCAIYVSTCMHVCVCVCVPQ